MYIHRHTHTYTHKFTIYIYVYTHIAAMELEAVFFRKLMKSANLAPVDGPTCWRVVFSNCCCDCASSLRHPETVSCRPSFQRRKGVGAEDVDSLMTMAHMGSDTPWTDYTHIYMYVYTYVYTYIITHAHRDIHIYMYIYYMSYGQNRWRPL